MNVELIRTRLHNINQELKGIWNHLKQEIQKSKSKSHDQSRVMTEEEQLDEELRESFPASDPPGHFSKSKVDQDLH
jgi:hypothetical protein